MKKTIVAVLVGSLILFIYQFLSWGLLNLHSSIEQYTPKQDSILSNLNSQFSEEGTYLLPVAKPGSTREEIEKYMKDAAGKPWAIISYHKKMDESMGMNMARGFLIDLVTIWLLCWLVSKMRDISFGNVLTASLVVGFIGFFGITYIFHIWFKTSDLMASFLDTLICWGIIGAWLGWWMTRKK